MLGGLRFSFAPAIAVCLCVAQQAAADGYFLQLDAGSQTQGFVASAKRGSVSYSLNLTDYDSGRSGAASVSYGWSMADRSVFNLGPAIGFQREDGQGADVRTGIKASLERYSPTPFGSAFVLADVSSVNRSWFLLGQLSHQETGLGAELSRGGSETYHETTFAVQKRLSDRPVSLRLGYKLGSDELFVGVAVNTF